MTASADLPETPATTADQDFTASDDTRGLVLWRGKPSAGCYALRAAWLPALVGLGMLLFAGLWEWVTLTGDHQLVFPLMGLPLVVLGVYAIAVRPLLLWLTAADLEYEIGGTSVVLRRGRWGRVVWSLASAALPPAAIVAAWPDADLAFFGVPERESPWGWWRLVDDRLRFSCLTAAAAAEALAAIESLSGEGGVTRPRAWARGLVTPQSTRYPGYDPQPPGTD